MKVAEEKKKEVLNRLSRLEGQIRGVRKMMEEEEDCEKILTQLSAVHSALEGATKLALANYFNHCLAEAEESQESQEHALDRFINLLLNTRM